MASSAIAAVGVQLGSVTLQQCQDAAEQVLACPTAAEAKEFARRLASPEAAAAFAAFMGKKK